MKSIKEVAETLGVGIGTVKSWVEDGKLAANKDAAGNFVFHESQVDDFIERTGIKLVKPVAITEDIIKSLQDQHSKVKGLMTADEIEQLFSDKKDGFE